eukprot:CAMPEP_0172757834 /NCGR_PEP_ID=MMETSP1074-20121228/164559_1 /TAXON_ID=2916 /ORGANISM="Ceratium fusus, Strain PA161109" /LENGTH=47 /DNA_ID= /DNA_START= /DNA_END= /DNA_ORIENTATION=
MRRHTQELRQIAPPAASFVFARRCGDPLDQANVDETVGGADNVNIKR